MLDRSNYFIERTSPSQLRLLPAAAHFECYVLLVINGVRQAAIGAEMVRSQVVAQQKSRVRRPAFSLRRLLLESLLSRAHGQVRLKDDFRVRQKTRQHFQSRRRQPIARVRFQFLSPRHVRLNSA